MNATAEATGPSVLTLSKSDPRDPGPGPRSFVERWFARRLRDERDLKFVRVAGVMSLLIWPAAASFYLFDLPGWLAFVYVPLLFGLGAGRFTLMLHAVCHRPTFKRDHKWLENWIPWTIGPFFGHTPNSFYVHHMGMHHPENNLPPDLSSTMAYQRDRFSHFLHYWARFFFFGTGHLLRYMKSRNRRKLFKRFVVGEGAWYLTIALLMALDPVATFVVFIVPWLLIRWFMMCGNWAQHAFVDIDDPGNCYRNSTCLTDVPYNHKCYNDGYHIVHHIKPALHWTEMPDWMMDRLDDFGREDALVFQGLGNNQVVWWCLMKDDYGKLADHLVDLPGAPQRTREQKIAMLQERVRRRSGDVKSLVRMGEGELPLAAK